jgi:2-keto-4-pentenoate hydratase/2-oxohepta-3-ene-1,7-dioic acid hydratase in catechol pathway
MSRAMFIAIASGTFQIEPEGQWVKGKSCDTFAPWASLLRQRMK